LDVLAVLHLIDGKFDPYWFALGIKLDGTKRCGYFVTAEHFGHSLLVNGSGLGQSMGQGQGRGHSIVKKCARIGAFNFFKFFTIFQGDGVCRDMSLETAIIYLYYLMICMVLFAIFVVNRLQNSRIGRAWFALREDEIACQAMGIDKTRTKLTAFALGSTWAGMAGVFFAAKTTFINPASFTFLESAIILCIVVLGGMGSIVGVIVGAFVLILAPEYLRVFADYRMLAFGTVLVVMMLLRPQGIVANVRRTYNTPKP
jgi:ABC-type branched-subunit amino acid transport system permease subunit